MIISQAILTYLNWQTLPNAYQQFLYALGNTMIMKHWYSIPCWERKTFRRSSAPKTGNQKRCRNSEPNTFSKYQKSRWIKVSRISKTSTKSNQSYTAHEIPSSCRNELWHFFVWFKGGKEGMWENTKQPKLSSALVVAQMKKPSTAEDLHGNKKAKQKTLKNP